MSVPQRNLRLCGRHRVLAAPDGSPLSAADLPPAGPQRWVIRKKAIVVTAVRGGLLSLVEACERYTLTIDEFMTWQRDIDAHGIQGLRATRMQDYRSRSSGVETNNE